MRVKLDNNQSILRIINNTDETIHYTPQLSMGIVDIRSLGYYNVRKSIMFFDKRGNNKIPPLHTRYHIYILEITTRQDRLKLKLNQLIKPLALNQLKKLVTLK